MPSLPHPVLKRCQPHPLLFTYTISCVRGSHSDAFWALLLDGVQILQAWKHPAANPARLHQGLEVERNAGGATVTFSAGWLKRD